MAWKCVLQHLTTLNVLFSYFYHRYEEEAPAVIEAVRPPPGWPHAGAIEARNLTVRYRPELDPVLTDLRLVISWLFPSVVLPLALSHEASGGYLLPAAGTRPCGSS